MISKKLLLPLYAVAIVLGVWPGGGAWVRLGAGVAGLVAIALTLDAVARLANASQTGVDRQAALRDQVNGLYERYTFMERDTTAALTAARTEELAERVLLLETRLAALEETQSDRSGGGPSVYAGWPRGAAPSAKNGKTSKRRPRPAYEAVAIDRKYVEIGDILYPIDGTETLFCAECHRDKKRLSEVSLREDRSAYFCDTCDTWIPTDLDDVAARELAFRQARGAAEEKP